MHVAHYVYLLQPYFVQANCHIVSCCASIMKCNMCGMEAKFRARGIGCPFLWWCQVCYDVAKHKDLPHDKEFPILCHKCNHQPATCRVQSKLKPCWSYWCYTCLEKDAHDGQSHDDMVIHDLDSASESNEDENVDDGVDDAVDDGTQSSSSFSSWHLPLASNLQALELQSNDDTMSIASSQSFMMAYEVLENDDTASMSSFQMVANTAPSVVDPDEQQEQQQQQDQEPDAEQDEQEPNMDALSIEGNVASNVGDEDPDAQQQDAQGINLGRWQEEQEILIAIDITKPKEDEAPVADSSSSSSSNMPTLAASLKLPKPKPKGKKVQRWPISDFGNVGLTGLVPIHESAKVKHNHEVELAKAIEASLDTSCIIYIDSLPFCSKHEDSMVESCPTCNQVCDLRDQLSQA